MAKVRVQDATKELSTNTGKMLDSISQMRKKTQDMLGSLRKISGDFAREAQEIRDRETREEQRKRYEAEAQFMNAYSSEQVPEVPAEPKVEEKAAPAPQPEPEQKAAPAPAAAPAAAGKETVKAPMPGTINAVKVSNGQAVKKGDVLVVLEAMKMENEIMAPCDGTFASVNVSQGATVNTGDVLVSLN